MFVRYISHEIRTPLNTVYMGLQLLESECRAHNIFRLKETVKDVKDSCEISLTILNDLLAYDKLEDGVMKLEVDDVFAWNLLQEVMQPFYIQVIFRN